MGNNNSGQKNEQNISREDNLLKVFYAKDRENEIKKINEGIYDDANKIYDKIWDGNKYIFVEKKIDIFEHPARGIPMPYIVDKDSFGSESNYEQLVSSENPRYIEFIICKGDAGEFKQKFAVNKSVPYHECKENCPCIEEIVEVIGEKNRIYKKDKPEENTKFFSLSPTSSEPFDWKLYNTNPNMGNMEPRKENGMGTDTCPGRITGKCPFGIGKCPYANGRRCPFSIELGPNIPGEMYNSMNHPKLMGGAKKGTGMNTSKKNELTKQIGKAFSTTSEMNETSSSAIGEKKKKKNKKHLENEDSTTTTSTSTTSTTISTTTDENDEEIEDDLEGLEDEEDPEENGFIIEQSDISSSDLYRMQSRIFGSETQSMSSTDHKSETTENVRQAMNKMNSRKTLFDTEDRNILELNSSTDEFMKRPTNKNFKYH